MFIHDGSIPVDFAIAVYKAMHNTSRKEDWENIDKYLDANEPIYEWITSILEDNGVENIENEMDWWKEQIQLKSKTCTCGNPQFGFDCMCEFVRENPGTINFTCEFCGIYTASKARCNKCEHELPDQPQPKNILPDDFPIE